MVTKFNFILIAVFFRFILDISYIYFVSPVYLYAGFEFSLNFPSYLLSFSVYIFFVVFFVSPRLMVVSDYFFVMAAFSVLAPLTSFYGLSGNSIYPVLIVFCSFSIVYFMTRRYFLKMPRIPFFREGYYFSISLSFLMIVFLVFWFWISGAVKYFNLDFSKVYEYREASAALANVGILSYLNGWVYQVFSLFLIAWLLLRRSFFYFFIFLTIQVFFYGVTAHKSVLFYPFLIVGIWYYFRKTDKLIVVPMAFSLVVFLSLALYCFSEHMTLGSMFIRRVFFIPAKLTYDYFEFFSVNQKVWWSNSLLSSYVNYPYDQSISKVIGEFNGSGSSANNGYISSGYAHAGLIGVLLYSLLFGLVLRFIDSVSARVIPLWFAVALTVVPIRSVLVSSDLLVVLLTHGLLVAIFLLVLVRRSPYVVLKSKKLV